MVWDEASNSELALKTGVFVALRLNEELEDKGVLSVSETLSASCSMRKQVSLLVEKKKKKSRLQIRSLFRSAQKSCIFTERIKKKRKKRTKLDDRMKH